ncbi:MAG: M48 family metallopeptidase [Candidatus Omnitrophica bacterium]|nr:M48 family metallopeptidase [Candidatus Omnitrophota bacterium]MBI2174628.1 M48 family metallopeptidase [Candidatus Omnitrophota bacterium]MBI3010654.1 M48 family metallopeptidase [Candidatus Omnitrophota bacterium]
MIESNSAKAYARIRYRLLGFDLLLTVVFLSVFWVSGFSGYLADYWQRETSNNWLIFLGYLLVFSLCQYLVSFPLHYYSTFHLEHRFGLSRMSRKAWWIREAKQIALGGVLGLLIIEAGYALLRHKPETWPLWATLGWLAFSVVLARVFPTLLLPLFYKTTRLEDTALNQRLLSLCNRAGLPVLGTFRFNLGAETRKANAALAGVGQTRRVLLADTLLSEFSPDEIEGVLAHELAHYRFHHIRKLLILSAIGSWIVFSLTDYLGKKWAASFGLSGLADIEGFPLLMLWLFFVGLVARPLQNGISRAFEWQADRFAVALAKPSAFAGALRRLGTLNLADPHPPRLVEWFFFDHPAISRRIQAAEQASYELRNHEGGSGVLSRG